MDRRDFLKTAGGGLTGAGVAFTTRETSIGQALSEQAKLDRIASNSYPLRFLFKSRPGGRGGSGGRGRAGQTMAPAGSGAPAAAGGTPSTSGSQAGQASGAAGRGGGRVPGRGMGELTPQQMKEKYGEITMLDFPQFTRDTFPGVTHMDVWS